MMTEGARRVSAPSTKARARPAAKSTSSRCAARLPANAPWSDELTESIQPRVRNVMTTPLKVWLEAEGRLLRLRLSRPKANIVDAAMIAAFDRRLAEHLDNADLGAILLDAEGPHFSFGASVEEHLPGQCASHASDRIHGLVLRLVKSPVPAADRRARPVPGRRARAGARRPPHVRRSRRQPRSTGNEARRVRAGRLLPVAGDWSDPCVPPICSVSGRSITGADAVAMGMAYQAAPNRNMPRSHISKSTCSRRAQARCAAPSGRRVSTSRARGAKIEPSRACIATS